jgi:oligoendopeptidase F
MEHLPHWDLNSIYPSLQSAEFSADLLTLSSLVAKGKELLQAPEEASWLTEVLRIYQQALDTSETLYAYARALLSVNTADKEAMRAVNRVEEALMELRSFDVQLLNRLAQRKEEVLALVGEDQDLAPYAFVIKELLDLQSHTMSEEAEHLASDLNRSGTDAWSRLQEAISSTAQTKWEGQTKTVIQLRSMAFDAQRSIRQKAFEAELGVWKHHEIALASALNGVKGTTLTLDSRRGYASPLERSAFQARISGQSLEAMIGSIEKSLPMFRRYLYAKAHALGLKRLAFYDLFAPLGTENRSYSYQEATAFIVEQFSRFHLPMGQFAQSAFEKNWVDSQPRSAKVGGAYCTSFPLAKESRILVNYDGTFDGLSTLAHEMGHAYHDSLTYHQGALLRQYPMTLAETASIFSQILVFQGAMEEASEKQQISLIEGFLQDATQTCVDILSRYYFENALFAKRKEGELLSDELNELMIDSQIKSYGDALDPQALHPYMWAVKGHYYSSDLSFYNYPYAFGQLFGLGVYRKGQESDDFGPEYDRLLTFSGQDSVANVALTIGLDIDNASFWEQSLEVIGTYVEQFCTLVGYSG